MNLGLFNIFFNRKKFKKFSVAVNDFRTNYDIYDKSEYLKTIELTDIIKPNLEGNVLISDYSYRQGNVTLYELYCICAIAKSFRASSIFEIGTYDGETTLHLALNSPENAKIYTLDLPTENTKNIKFSVDSGDPQLINKKGFRTGEKFLDRKESQKITQLFADSALFDYSEFKEKVDIFFIDGAHSYDYVKTDTENAFYTLNENGIIIWHDYGNIIDVIKYLNELSSVKPLYRINRTTLAIFSNSLFVKNITDK
ncbi:MAG: class I SAM-dependent methyltransferase [Chlorobi bacterium]|nr:class I SAM-dependent methyltransferase [Chlorobiota bacterium]MCI0714847.1 class I SAM-dependent methyltransferase [Chlorobiota bacterium]